MKIGILSAGHLPEDLARSHGTYSEQYARLLDGHGFSFRNWNVVDMEFPSSPEDADGWLISGSRHGAYEDLPFIAPLEQFVRDVMASGRPLIGVCFGHQVIAQAMGGKVIKFPGGWSVGHTEYDYDGRKVTMNAWHQDQIAELPEGAEVLGQSDFCRYAMLGYGDRAFTVQAHPEFSADMVEGLARTRGRGVIPEPVLQGALEQLDAADDRKAFAAEMAAFFKRNAKEQAA